MERESILSVYSSLYTYDADSEKNNSILKSAVRTSKSLGQMLSNMQDSMRLWFDELSKRRDFIGIQEVLVNEINNRESVKYAILTTTDSFYRYKEAVKELIAKILEENENRREKLMAQKRMLAAQTGGADALQETAADGSTPALLKLERGIQFCEEAAQLVLLVEREFDLIEKKYNRLIELKTVFARRALARIHYLLQEGAGAEDSTLELIGLLNNSGNTFAIVIVQRLPRHEQLQELVAAGAQRPHLRDGVGVIIHRAEAGDAALHLALDEQVGRTDAALRAGVLSLGVADVVHHHTHHAAIAAAWLTGKGVSVVGGQAAVGAFCRGFRRGFGVRGSGFGAFRRGGTVALP